MEPTNCVPVSIRMKHVQCFVFSGELYYGQSRIILSAGEQRDSKKQKLQPKIAELGKTHCLERSRIYDGSHLTGGPKPLSLSFLSFFTSK